MIQGTVKFTCDSYLMALDFTADNGYTLQLLYPKNSSENGMKLAFQGTPKIPNKKRAITE